MYLFSPLLGVVDLYLMPANLYLLKKNSKIPNGSSQAVNRKRIDNTMVTEWKRTKGQLQLYFKLIKTCSTCTGDVVPHTIENLFYIRVYNTEFPGVVFSSLLYSVFITKMTSKQNTCFYLTTYQKSTCIVEAHWQSKANYLLSTSFEFLNQECPLTVLKTGLLSRYIPLR